MIGIDSMTGIIIFAFVVFLIGIRPAISPYLLWLKESLFDAFFMSLIAISIFWILYALHLSDYQFGYFDIVWSFATYVVIGSIVDYFKKLGFL